MTGTPGEDNIWDVALDPAGNVYAAGMTSGGLDGNINSGGKDIVVMKYDSVGNKLWTRQMGTSSDDVAFGVATDMTGSIYVSGRTYGSLGDVNAGGADIFLMKLDLNGFVIWTRQFGSPGDDFATRVAVDDTGNAYVTGYTSGGLEGSPNSGGFDLFLIKYDQNGNRQWTRQMGTAVVFGFPPFDGTISGGVAVDWNNDIYLSGIVQTGLDGNPYYGGQDIVLIKFDQWGAWQWTRQSGTGANDMGLAVAAFGGGVYIAGNTDGSLDGNAYLGNTDIFIMQYDTAGNKIWTRQLGTPSADFTHNLTADMSGNVYLIGMLHQALDGNYGYENGCDIGLFKLDSMGNTLLAQKMGELMMDHSLAIGVDNSGYLYIGGQTENNLGGNINQGGLDIFLMKVENGAGSVWQWGYNPDGWSSTTPVQVTGLSGISTIAGSMLHSMALQSDGTIKAWGENGFGQFGDGTYDNSQTPVPVPGLPAIQKIAAGWFHSLALGADGTLWRWGTYSGPYYSLPDLTGLDVNHPVQITEIGPLPATVKISGGGQHSAILKEDGTVWAWGANNFGQLGNGTTANSVTPVQALGLPQDIISISAGGDFTLALRADGTVLAWGNNTDGQLGDGTNNNSTAPVQVTGLDNVIAIFGGWWHSMALKADGTVWTWGRNLEGQLGNGTNTGSNVPVQVYNLDNVTAIDGECFSSLALRSDGTVWEWGNYYDGTTQHSNNAPVQVSGLSGVTAIAGGMDQRIVLKSSNALAITTSSLPDGTVNVPYNGPMLEAVGGTPYPGIPRYMWSIISGNLPPGLFLGVAYDIEGTPTAAGKYDFTVQATDMSGNTATKPLSITINNPTDTTPPSGSMTIDNGAAYTNSLSVTLALSCTDNASGCSEMQFSNDNVVWSAPENYVSSRVWPLSSGDGTYTVYARFKDNAGNWSGPYSDSIVLDATGPSGTLTINNGSAYTTTGTVTLSLTCTDALSGCSWMSLSNDGYNWFSEPFTGTKTWVVPEGDGEKTVLLRITDIAGNMVSLSSSIILDTRGPSGAVTINSGSAYANSLSALLSLSCTDSNGCSEMQFSNDNVNWSAPGPFAAETAWTLDPGEGTKTVYARFKDGAGNWSDANSAFDSIVYDGTAPVAEIVLTGAPGQDGWYTSEVTATLAATDEQSGVAAVEYGFDGTSWTLYSNAFRISEEVTNIYYRATDNAGNREAVKVRAVKTDYTFPFSTIGTPAVVNHGINTGPYGGRIDSLALSPNYAVDHTVFAGTYGSGVFKSTDGGANWAPVNAGIVRQYIRSLALSPDYASDLTLFAGANGALYRSTDGGASWSRTGIPQTEVILSLALSPNYAVDRTVFAGSGQSGAGIYKSTDGGASWTVASTGIERVQALAVSPDYTSDRTVFAGSYYGGVFKSADGGASWVSVNTGINDTYIYSVAISPNYAVDRTVFARSQNGFVFKSMDGGTSWTAAGTGIMGYLAVSPNYAVDQTVFAGNYKTTDGGASWTAVYPGSFSCTLSPDYANDQTVFARTAGNGVLKTVDAGASWTAVNTGITAVLTESLALSPNYASDHTIYAGSHYGGMYKTTDEGATWTAVDTGFPNALQIESIALSPDYASDRTVFAGSYYARVYSTTDDGATWTQGSIPSPTAIYSLAVSPDYAADRTVFAGGGDYSFNKGKIFKTVDGTSWTTVYSSSLYETAVYSLAASPNYAADGTVFAATDFGILKTTNGGASWIQYGYPHGRTVAVSPNYASDQTVFVGRYGAGVMKTTDGGTSWNSANTGLSSLYILSIAVSPNYPADGTVFAGTGDGMLFKTTDGGTNWAAVNTGIPGLAINVLALSPDYAVDKTVFAGTPGGVYKIVIGGETIINGSSCAVSGAASDGTGSGVQKVEVSTDNGASWNPAAGTTSWSYTWTLPADGSYTIRSRATDNAGNVEISAAGVTIAIDNTAPASTASPAGGLYNSSRSVVLTANETATIYYTTDGSTPTTGSAIYSIPIDVPVTTTLKFFARDIAGNDGAVTTEVYTIDETAPTGSVIIDSGATYAKSTSVNLSLSCEDGGGSGCVEMRFSNDGADWSVPEPFAVEKAWTLGSGDGTKTVYVMFKDIAGNWSNACSDSIVLDTTAPAVSIAAPPAQTNDSTPLLMYTVSDGIVTAKVDGITVSKVSGDSLDALADGPHTVRVESTDAAGNTGYAETAFTVDTVPPTISIDPVTSPTKLTSQTITGNRESGATVAVSVDTTATAGPAAYPTATTWSCAITNLVRGTNTIIAVAGDAAGNTANATVSIKKTH